MLFDEQVSRRPDLYPWTQEFIDKMWNGMWTPNTFDFKSDIFQFETALDDQQREIITKTLSAIGQIEIAVKTFWARLGDNLPHPSINDLGLVMANSEVIHNKAYEKLLDLLKLGAVFEENLKLPVVNNRVKYLKKYLKRMYADNKKQYIYAIILFTLFVENVSLFSQFYVILWFNRFVGESLLKDTAQQVQYTRNEETLHSQVGIKLIQTMKIEYPELFDDELQQRIISECFEAVEAEGKIIEWIVGDFDMPGLNANILKTYIKARMNESLVAIGYPKAFNNLDAKLLNETEWMYEELYGNNVVDFFHKHPVDYAKHNRAFNVEELF